MDAPLAWMPGATALFSPLYTPLVPDLFLPRNGYEVSQKSVATRWNAHVDAFITRCIVRLTWNRRQS